MNVQDMTSIIIPSYNGLELLRSCMDSIRKWTEEPYETIVVDNRSTDGTYEYCVSERIKVISLPENRGFPKACNSGLRLARGGSLLLLNNDVTVTRNWLTQLKQGLFSDPMVGIVGPVTNYASGIQQINIPFDSKAQFLDIAAAHNHSDPSRWIEVPRIVGLCFMFKRELMEKIGYLDERFSPGHYEDDDYCYRARLAGYRLLVCGDTLVHHEGSASFRKSGEERLSELVKRNRELFIDKWQIDPLQYI